MDRREWLGQAVRGGVAGGGALMASTVLQADADDTGIDATLARWGASGAVADERLQIDVASEAWSGAFVMVFVDATAIDDVRVVHVLRDEHASAEIATLAVQGSVPARFSLPVRLDRPCQLLALVETADGWLRAEARVDTVGAPGCG